MKLTPLLLTSVGMALLPASAQVLQLDFGPATAFGASRTNSPCHTLRTDLKGLTWNRIGIADVTTGLLTSEGGTATGVSLNIGASEVGGTTIHLNKTPSGISELGAVADSGIYSGSSPAKDGIFSGAGGERVAVGVEIGGLPAGTYEIYITGRNTNSAFAHSQNFYAGKSPNPANFDFANGFAHQEVFYPTSTTADYFTQNPAFNAQNKTWQTGTLANYAVFIVTLSAGDVLQLAVAGGVSETRGFLNSIQIIPAQIPDPSSYALLAQ